MVQRRGQENSTITNVWDIGSSINICHSILDSRFIAVCDREYLYCWLWRNSHRHANIFLPLNLSRQYCLFLQNIAILKEYISTYFSVLLYRAIQLIVRFQIPDLIWNWENRNVNWIIIPFQFFGISNTEMQWVKQAAILFKFIGIMSK